MHFGGPLRESDPTRFTAKSPWAGSYSHDYSRQKKNQQEDPLIGTGAPSRRWAKARRICACVCVSVCLSVCLPVCLSACLLVFRFVFVFVVIV